MAAKMVAVALAALLHVWQVSSAVVADSSCSEVLEGDWSDAETVELLQRLRTGPRRWDADATAGDIVSGPVHQILSYSADPQTPVQWQPQEGMLGSRRGPAEALVHEVYTYGAPATRAVPFHNAARADGCFPGLRSYNEDLKSGVVGEVHTVDAASLANFKPHAFINSVALHWGRDSYFAPCGQQDGGHPDWPIRGTNVWTSWDLHHESHYHDRLGAITLNGRHLGNAELFSRARQFALLAWRAYDVFLDTSFIHMLLPGWRLVHQVADVHGNDVDPIWLLQEVSTLDCVLTFTGTNDFLEFGTSVEMFNTGYCGFDGVHAGYRNELWDLTLHAFPYLRPSLEQCRRVICVGHSLGGSLCELFAACANSGHYGDPDYKLLAWTRRAPQLMKEYVPQVHHSRSSGKEHR